MGDVDEGSGVLVNLAGFLVSGADWCSGWKLGGVVVIRL